MAFTAFFRPVLAILAAIFLLMPDLVSAHEGHKKDMSDAEMMQMDSQNDTAENQMLPDNASGNMHDTPTINQTHHAGNSVVVPQTPEQALRAKVEDNRVTSGADFLGRLHPMATHFPIALVLMAAFAELLLFLRPSLGLKTTLRFLIVGGAAGAVVAALFGWFAAGWRLQDRSDTLAMHRWNGTAIASIALITAWLALRASKRTGLRILLVILVILILIQGYLGGEMVFGPNHLGLE